MGAPAAAGNVAHVSSDDVDEPSSPKNHGALQDAIMQRVRSTLPHHPVRESLQRDARSMSLQSMCRTYPSSFNRMFGQRVGKPKKRICVRIHKMLNSLISDERPVIPCKSDFCEVDAVDLNGETTVHWTCRSGDTNKLHWLIGAGYNLKIKNKKGETGLHIACFSGSDACLEILAASGKFVEEDLDALDADGWGALHWAVEQNNLRCVRMMLMHKADANLRLPNGKTPLDLAINADSSGSHMMRLLRKQEASGTVKHRSVKAVNKALRKFRRSTQHEDEPISQPPTQAHAKETKWRHLKAQQGYRERIHMKKLLNERIQTRVFEETEEEANSFKANALDLLPMSAEEFTLMKEKKFEKAKKGKKLLVSRL